VRRGSPFAHGILGAISRLDCTWRRGAKASRRRARYPQAARDEGMRGEDIDTRRRRAVYRATHRGTKEMDWTSAVTPLRCCRNWRGVRSIASNDC